MNLKGCAIRAAVLMGWAWERGRKMMDVDGVGERLKRFVTRREQGAAYVRVRFAATISIRVRVNVEASACDALC